MPVGPHTWPHMYPIKGFSLSAAEAGVRYSGRSDVVLMFADDGSQISGVFTKNAFAAAPVIIAKSALQSSFVPQALIINSGNANACTGELGITAATQTCDAVAKILNIRSQQVLPFSTGVIGEQLKFENIISVLPELKSHLNEDYWLEAAQAIMTTDTRPKGASERVVLSSGEVIHITGIAKGSGMINPNMGTMLAYIATDANISKELVDQLSLEAAQRSFNRITIDGDTSTNDAAILVATCKVGNVQIDDSKSNEFLDIKNAIVRVYESLAKQIIQDGEGATKCVEVLVKGGLDSQECYEIAYAIAHSPLVKTALFASDPNWGRIVAAIGYANVKDLDAHLVDVYLDDVQIVSQGQRAESYTEQAGQEVLHKEEFMISVNVNRGSKEESIWTSDLSHEYIKINADYRS